MPRLFAPALALVLLGLTPLTGQAAWMVNVSSESNLNQVQVGDVVTIRVMLSGITGPADYLDSLGARVEFSAGGDSTVFSTPTLTVGSIVPDPGSVLFTTGSGLGDATYDVFLSPAGLPITENGVFFSLTMQAQRAGSGTFEITSTSGFVGFDPVTVEAGAPVNFTIQNAPVTAVPEPSSLGLLASGLVFSAVGALSRRFRRPAGCQNEPTPDGASA